MKDDKLYRVTFSRSLAEFLAGREYDIRVFKAAAGAPLATGSHSRTGLYGIISARNQKLLRISLSKAHAELLCGDRWRYVAECALVPVA